jgi:hypothetical protein
MRARLAHLPIVPSVADVDKHCGVAGITPLRLAGLILAAAPPVPGASRRRTERTGCRASSLT